MKGTKIQPEIIEEKKKVPIENEVLIGTYYCEKHKRFFIEFCPLCED